MAVALGRRAHDLDRDVQIANHPTDHHQLLPVLLSEDCEIGPDLIEQLADHQSHAAEHLRAERPFKPFGRSAHADGGGRTVRIHFLDRRGVEQVAAGAGQQFSILRLLSGIGPEILVCGELGRVHEDAGDDPVGPTHGLAHQCQVAFVQRAHGRHEADGEPLSPPVAYVGAKVRDGAGDGQGSDVGHGERERLSR